MQNIFHPVSAILKTTKNTPGPHIRGGERGGGGGIAEVATPTVQLQAAGGTVRQDVGERGCEGREGSEDEGRERRGRINRAKKRGQLREGIKRGERKERIEGDCRRGREGRIGEKKRSNEGRKGR